MQSRVRGACDRHTIPPRLGSGTALALADQHQTQGLAGLGGQLQSASFGERQGCLRFGDDQTDWSSPQGVFDRPKEICLPLRRQEDQPLAEARGKTRQERSFGDVVRHDPDHRPGMAHRLKQGKGSASSSICLVHPIRCERQRICWSDPLAQIKQHLRAHLPPR